MKIKYPKGEKAWVSYFDLDHNLRFIMTSKAATRDYYYLYELVGEEFKKLGKSRYPPDLEEKFKVKEQIQKYTKKK